MTIGDLVPNQTMDGLGRNHKPVTVPGRCVYIHPDRRFYTLEFVFLGGKIRESFNFQHRRGETSK